MKPIEEEISVCIRPATAKDLDEVHKLDSSYMVTTVTKDWLRNRMDEYPDLFYVAHDSRGGADVIGYICGSVYSHPFSGRLHGYVSRIAVLPKYRRRGVGSMLLNALEYAYASYRGYSNIYVGVRLRNNIAQDFYHTNGFLRIPEFDNPNGYTVDAALPEDRYMVVMSKPLYRPEAYQFNACVFIDSKMYKVAKKRLRKDVTDAHKSRTRRRQI